MDVCTGSITSPWRFQGRILESADGSTDLYDFSARSYDPGLGAFTSFDSVAGGAQNPLTLNRYLYANANPATLVDPTGHFAGDFDDERGLVGKKKASGNGNGGGGNGGGGNVPSAPGSEQPGSYTPGQSMPGSESDDMGVLQLIVDDGLVMFADGTPIDEEMTSLAGSMCQSLADQIACHAYTMAKCPACTDSDGIHATLGAASVAGPLGPLANALDAFVYAAEGDLGSAGLSALGAVPVAGDALDVARDASRALRTLSKADLLAANAAKGRKFEELLGFTKAREAIDVGKTAGGRILRRFPDNILKQEGVIQEAKNTARIAGRSMGQMQDYVRYAASKGWRVELYVPQGCDTLRLQNWAYNQDWGDVLHVIRVGP